MNSVTPIKKRRLLVCVSGGRTSAYMAWWLKKHCSHLYEFIFIFANTGLEHWDTLRFIHDVDRYLLDGELIIVEADVIHEQRVGTTFSLIGFQALAKLGEPYEEVMKKYGIANKTFPHCTRELKERPMNAYAKSVWGNDYTLAIGIRADERRRVAESGMINKRPVIYPLADPTMHPVDKVHILDWFSQFDWDLKIPQYLGNCITCWKKSYLKLNAVWWDNPAHFEPFARYEKEYGLRKPPTDKTPGARVFFRGYKSALQLCDEFKTLNRDTRATYERENEASGECDESCEPFPMVVT